MVAVNRRCGRSFDGFFLLAGYNLSASLRSAPPLDKGSLGCVQIKKIQCKKVQSDKIRLHLLFIANILRKLLTNLIPTYQAARSQTYVR